MSSGSSNGTRGQEDSDVAKTKHTFSTTMRKRPRRQEFPTWSNTFGTSALILFILFLLILFLTTFTTGDRGSTVVKVLCYKSEGR